MDATFTFAGGRFLKAELPEFADDGRLNGYWQEQSFGDSFGMSFELYASEGDLKDWIVCVSTASHYCLIRVDTWPDLIELLAKLSGPTLAGMLMEEQLEAIGDLLEPTIEARRRQARALERKLKKEREKP